MASLVARSTSLHNLNGPDPYSHSHLDHFNGNQEYYYQKEASGALLPELPSVQRIAEEQHHITYLENEKHANEKSNKRKRSTDDDGLPTKLRDVFTPLQNKLGRLQIEIPGISFQNISVFSCVCCMQGEHCCYFAANTFLRFQMVKSGKHEI